VLFEIVGIIQRLSLLLLMPAVSWTGTAGFGEIGETILIKNHKFSSQQFQCKSKARIADYTNTKKSKAKQATVSFE